MKIKIEIKTDNQAFEDNPNELEEILTNGISYFIRSGKGNNHMNDHRLYDSYGNSVGFIYKVN